MSPILILDHDDPEREFEFELKYLMSLTTQQRFEMMIKRSNDVKEMLIRHGYRRPVDSTFAAGNERENRGICGPSRQSTCEHGAHLLHPWLAINLARSLRR